MSFFSKLAVICCVAFTAYSAHASTLRWPVEFAKPWTQISSSFGPRLHASQNYEYEFHKGIDIAGEATDTVVAAADGEVSAVYAESDSDSPYPNGGNVVVLRHTAPTPIWFHGQTFTTYYTLYLHLSIIDPGLTVGGSLQAGDVLGYIGSSGTTEFTHLHFEVRVGAVCSTAAVCNTTGFDPHVHPLRYLQYPQKNHVRIRADRYKHALRVHIRTRRNEPDINRILVTTYDAEDRQLKRRVVNFSRRRGTSRENIVLKPKRYSTRSSYYRLGVGFHNVVDLQTRSIRVTACDTHKNCSILPISLE